MKEAYVRPLAQLFAEMDDIWEKRLDDFEMSATADSLHLTKSVEVKLIHQMLEFKTTQAPLSKEMELMCLERFESILTGKRNRKRFNDTHKKYQLALNVYLNTYYKEENHEACPHACEPCMVPSYSSFRRNQPIEPETPWWIFDDGCHDVLRSRRL